MFGAAAMSLSSFCVVSNALRLNLFDLHSTKHDHPLKNASALPAALTQPAAVEDKESTIKEDTTMKKTLHVEGMMCGHCEARVKKALEALPEVTEAVVSHEAGTAVVTLSAEVPDDVLKKAVEDQDYKVTSRTNSSGLFPRFGRAGRCFVLWFFRKVLQGVWLLWFSASAPAARPHPPAAQGPPP